MFSPITTNNICDQNCPILSQLRARGLTNEGLTRVKVIFVPQFLTKTSIFGLDYKEFVRGAHLGVFASLYEPFGYTSPECMCVGTASVVSNLCGCGNLFEKTQKELRNENDLIKKMEDMHRASSSNLLAMEHISDLTHATNSPKPITTGNVWVENQLGVGVVDRVYKGYGETVDQLERIMEDYLRLDTYDRVALRNRMARNCVIVDWSVRVQDYIDVYEGLL